jgi:hypothetical protein
MANEIENATTGTTQAEEANWKTRIYVSGTVLGGFLGLLSAYLFARSAEENEDKQPPQVATGTLISLLLAVLGLMRQIAESGKQKKK